MSVRIQNPGAQDLSAIVKQLEGAKDSKQLRSLPNESGVQELYVKTKMSTGFFAGSKKVIERTESQTSARSDITKALFKEFGPDIGGKVMENMNKFFEGGGKVTVKDARAVLLNAKATEKAHTMQLINNALGDGRINIMESPPGKQDPLNGPMLKEFFSAHIDILLKDELLSVPFAKGQNDIRPNNSDMFGAFTSLTVLRNLERQPDITDRDVADMEKALSPNRFGRADFIESKDIAGPHMPIKEAIDNFDNLTKEDKLKQIAILVQKRFCENDSGKVTVDGQLKNIPNHFVNAAPAQEKDCKAVINNPNASAADMINAIEGLIMGSLEDGKGGQGQSGTAGFVQPMLKNLKAHL